MASERVTVVRGVRRVIGGWEVEIVRHGKGFRVYGVVQREKTQGTTLKRLPEAQERQVMALFGSPYSVD